MKGKGREETFINAQVALNSLHKDSGGTMSDIFERKLPTGQLRSRPLAPVCLVVPDLREVSPYKEDACVR